MGTSGTTGRSSNTVTNRGVMTNGRQSSGATSTRQAGTRYTVDPNVTRSARTGQSGSTRSTETLNNYRRSQSSGGISQQRLNAPGQNGQTTRQSSSNGNSQNYTPTYSRPRTNTQATYNSGTTRQYSRPQSSGSAVSSDGNRYSRPATQSSSGSVNSNSGRSSSSSSYQRGSSSSSSASPARSSSSNSYSAPSRSSSSESYSAPSRSSSSGSSSGGSYSGGGSSSGSGSSSGGGGGSGRRQ